MPLLPRDPGGQGGGIEEAPLDGKLYGRRMARWDEVPKLLTLIYYRGPFVTPDELRAAYPTDVPGAYAIVSSTSSIWIWNHDKWEDTGATQTQAGILDAPHDGQTYGRKDGGWVVAGGGTVSEDEVVNIIKNTQHNILKGIQGGKVENGRVTEAYHLTREEWEKLPVRPSVISPANGETNINQAPQIVGTPYAHPYDAGMSQKHIQIATTNDFAAPVYEKVEFSGTPVFQVSLKADNAPYLAQDTVYYVRIRYQDRRGRWSHWSAPSTFRTMVQFPAGVLLTPIMTAPSDGGEASAVNPVLGMSSPKVLAGTGNFDKGDWQISTDSTFATTLYDAQGTDDLIFHTTTGLNLTTTLGMDFFARGRQRATDGTYTPWAVPVRFGLRPEYSDPIFGLRRIFSKRYGHAFVYNIDPEGKIVRISKAYWAKHPLYQFPKRNLVVAQKAGGENIVSEMAYVPPCWIKHRVYDNDDGDMVIDLWFSMSNEGPDWILAPAFARSPNGILISTCFSSNAVTEHNKSIYASVPGVAGANVFLAANVDELNILETGSRNGSWHVPTIYERQLLLDLMAAEFTTQNPMGISSSWGNSNTDGNMKWHGLYGPLSQGSVYHGVSFSYSGDLYTSIQISTPQMDPGFLMFPLNYPSKEQFYGVTDIMRGYNSHLGFDIALLGIITALAPRGGSPFGMNDVYFRKEDFVDGGCNIADTRLGMLGLAKAWSGYTHSSRLSKWLD